MSVSKKIFLIGAVLFAMSSAAQANLIVYTVDTVSDQLYTIDVMTGTSTAIGEVGFGDVEGLSFQPGTGVLYGLDDDSDQLITVNTITGAGTVVGALGANFGDAGLAFSANGNLYGGTDLGTNDGFYSINVATGAASIINGDASDAHGLAFFDGVMYGISDEDDGLFSIDLISGAETSIGTLGFSTDEDGFIIDASGNGYLLQDDVGGGIYSINLNTGASTFLASYSCDTCKFESAALVTTAVPEPSTLAIFALGMIGLASRRLKKQC